MEDKQEAMERRSDLLYLVNHVFLPPKLPQCDDSGDEQDLVVVQELESALRAYVAHVCPEQDSVWQACIAMVSSMRSFRDASGELVPSEVEGALEKMCERGMLFTPTHD